MLRPEGILTITPVRRTASRLHVTYPRWFFPESAEEGRRVKGPGANLQVPVRVVAGSRERVQVFEGDVIARQGSGVRETYTVRKFSFGVGVERTFPVHSPTNANACVHIAFALAVDTNFTTRNREGIVIRKDRAAIAVAPERLAREEARAADRRQVAALLAFIRRAKTLGSITENK